ncbi:MAG: extracellular solute-binding protein family 1 [Herbinix sp.]|jgi:multiple sugar transport system substrate-binding protein|nr:extracellular solute-binding protein family 1 [Herbinix sp.]
MKNFKKLLAMVLVIAFIMSLATACSGKKEETSGSANPTQGATETKDNEDAGKDETQPAEKTKVVIWSKDRHDADFVTQKVAEYNETNTDNIEVDFQIYTDNYPQAIDMAFQSGEAPDMFSQETKVFESHLGGGRLADLAPFMDDTFKTTFAGSIIPGLNDLDGKIYYVPVTGTTGRLFYNKNIFEKAGIATPPATFEEMVADAKIITEKLSGEGIYGFAANMKNPGSALNRSLMYQVQRQLGLQNGYNFATGEFDFAPYADLLAQWKELLSGSAAFPGCESLDIDPLRTQFAAGKIGMYISFTHAEPGVYKNQFPMTDEWGVVQIPTLGGQVTGAQGYVANGGYLFNAESEKLEAAWKVYNAIFMNIDYQVEYYEAGLGISIVPAVIEKAKPAQVYVDNQDLLIGATDSIWPRNPQEAYSTAFILEGMDSNTTFASMFYGDTDIVAGLQDLTDRYNAALKAGIDEGTVQPIVKAGFDAKNPTK